ncbi:MAG: sigma-70 family RNA polymerase sigma factor [Myxococcales bacterium]|nr:sigma-70 family RNA polymerase sigma factor [Myxococcales bacterium]
MTARRDVTELLKAATSGDTDAAEQLMPIVYDDLRRRAAALMRRESAGHTLQPTALVNEAYMRLINQERVDWQGRGHFFGTAAQIMRRVLVDHARARGRQKRGGDVVRVQLGDAGQLSSQRDADVLVLDEVLKKLAEVDPAQADIVVMRFFGGMTVDEVALVLGVSKRTVEAEWTMIKAWLRRELRGD